MAKNVVVVSGTSYTSGVTYYTVPAGKVAQIEVITIGADGSNGTTRFEIQSNGTSIRYLYDDTPDNLVGSSATPGDADTYYQSGTNYYAKRFKAVAGDVLNAVSTEPLSYAFLIIEEDLGVQ